ncbi:sulfite exporter TauE/SafE family protein [Zafaria sp. Z1313]|uniref:sulfite exporter TauE/SafE family protein n=1 Tax=unclassified Zafaria TaxID=2828765 RepID=UPI002E75A2F1|nr:sulfite exporter TauE/SafE family protein [Zafaria sp. J156]MEE1619833.1 sulfite exporter TauE/SafE family protein [Zafaria sp. J156]
METALLAAVLAFIVVGAVAQRVAGLGFAMLVAPFLVLLLGPHAGVFLVNICGVVSSALIAPRVWKDIDWSMFRWLTLASVAGSVPGAVAAGLLPSAVLSVFVGAVVLAALVLSLLLSRANRVFDGKPVRVGAGLLAGLTNAMAGVGGPAVSAYAVLARWPQRPFAATLQPFFVVIGLVAVSVKLATHPEQLPLLDWWAWGLITGAIILGILGGERLQRHVSDRSARLFVVVVAFAGALSALAKGLIELA